MEGSNRESLIGLLAPLNEAIYLIQHGKLKTCSCLISVQHSSHRFIPAAAELVAIVASHKPDARVSGPDKEWGRTLQSLLFPRRLPQHIPMSPRASQVKFSVDPIGL